jgi:hypothetical protein
MADQVPEHHMLLCGGCDLLMETVDPPPLDTDAPGLHLTLKTLSLYSLQRGYRIYAARTGVDRANSLNI